MSTKKNISSGADKAEKLTRKQNADAKTTAQKSKSGQAEIRKPAATAKPASTKNKVGSTKHGKPAVKTSEKKQQAIRRREEKKAEAAKIRAERKQKKLEKKLEAKQKRLDRIAAMKEKKAERKEARRERRDLLKNETKSQRIERKKSERQARIEARVARREAAAADRRAKREHRLKLRAEKRAERNEKRHAPGFGGWLAAVISLGVTTLALATMVTFGWMNMNGMQADMASVQTHSLYELNSIVDNLDTNLSKARVSTSVSDRVRVLSDIAIESEMAETLLERMPMECVMTEEITSFINKMGDSAQNMLFTVAEGGELSSSQVASLKYMYETNLKVKRALNELIANSNNADVISMMRGKGSIINESFSDIQNNVIEAPKGIHDGPFSDSVEDTNPSFLKGLEEITAPQAEKTAREYFADYNVSEARCTGEAMAKGMSCYNVVLTTDDGEMLAQLSKNGGKLVMFDSYKDCSDVNFSVDRCLTIAEDFLAKIGYGELKAVWTSENGTTCNINFAPEQDGAVLYPDLIKVKVCEERGLVTGVEALSYVLNHSSRNIAEATVSRKEAQSVIDGNIEVTSSRLALIPFEGEEILCYEFVGTVGDSEYYVYVDAATGNEVEVLTVVGTKQGRVIL